ncbi:NADH-quinone oxidoreductase subunit J [Rhodococcus sp. NPDC058505]|uniref:NADH-quinone oxidoreductase subunit J n=1 Tax=unclassified Rhodococcus (in: high G+C Gram-positive bacteria) TaxID=192944 RepID=UPI00366215B6
MTAGGALAAAVLAEPLTRTSDGEAVQFWILGALCVIGALGVVCAPKAVYSAIFLAMTMIILAFFYIAQEALFLGVVQIVVYTGAVMMLFLFVLMLIGVDSSDSLVETLRGQRVAAAVAGIGFGVLLIGGIGSVTVSTFAGLPDANVAPGPDGTLGNVPALAELIFLRYVWAFELTGGLLIVATIGAMVLAHRERIDPKPDQRALAEQRFRDGGQVTPLPSPGVYARHNAVDMAALLPDGSPAPGSVSGILTPRRSKKEGER